MIATIVFGGNALGLTAHSKHLMELQQEFQNATPLHTIVFIDREIVQQRMDERGIDQEKQPDQRNKVIAEFVEERVGIALDERASDAIGDYFTTGMNVAVPTENKATGEAICAVLGANPETSARHEAERFLYWKQMKGHVHEYEGKDIAKILSKREFALLADLHETFHCMDPYYIVKQKTGEYENEPTVHKAEAYAEVGALLYLAQRGLPQLTETRSLYRIVGSFMVGRYGNELLGPNLFTGINFGVVYSFYPAMFATQKLIDQGLGILRLSEIQTLAHQVVEEHAVSDNMAHAMTHYQVRPESLEKMIQSFKNDDNEFLRNKFAEVEKYRNQYTEVLEWAFQELLH